MDASLYVLLIDNNRADCDLAARELCREFPAARVEQVSSAQELEWALADGVPDLVISDYDLSWSNGLAVLRAIKAHKFACPTILFTQTISQEIAAQAIQAGLDGYIPKSPQNVACLVVAAWSALVKAHQSQAIRETETRYRDLAVGVPAGLYRTTPSGNILSANPVLMRLLGYPDMISLLKMNVTESFVNPQDRLRWQALIEQEGVVHDFQMPIRRRDGTVIWVEDNGRAIRDADGVVRYYEGSLIDVTEQVQAEEALKRERDFTSAILNTASALVVVLDSQGRIVRFNLACQQTTGYSLDEVVGKYVWDLLLIPEDVEQVKAVFAELQAGQFSNQHENFWVAKDGSQRLIAWSNTTVLDDAGLIEYVIGIGVDITERKRTEEALERRAIQLALINDIGEKIAAVLELDHVLNRAALLVQERFDYHHVALFTLDHKQGEIVMRARAGDFVFPPHHRLKLDQGIVGWVARHGESKLSNDVAAEPNYVNLYPGVVPTQSELSVPIQVSEEVVGVLDIQSPRRNAFDENDVLVIETLGAQIAVAIENARLYEEVKQRNQELAVLNVIGQAITSSLDLQETLTLIADYTTHLLDVTAASVFLCDEDNEVLRLVAGSNRDADVVVGKSLPMGQGIAGWVAQHGEAALVTNTSQDPRWFGDFEESHFRTHSILCVPLQIKEQVIGVLQAINKKKHDFDLVDLRFMEALAAPAATSIEHAQLFEQVQAAHEQLQALSHRLVQVQETERRNISREIHDESGQILSALLLGLSLLEGEAEHPQAVVARAADLTDMVDSLLKSLHRLAVNLRPASLDHLGLAAALEQYLETFREGFGLQQGIEVRLQIVGMEDERLPPALETAFYRVVQESLTNVARHAQASQVDVHLERSGDQARVTIQDDGVGFDPREARQSGRLGLFGMQERADMLGGTLTIESAVGVGTTIRVEAPCGD